MGPMPPSREMPENGADRAAVRQLSASEFVAELSALISELESAACGSQSLDVRIHYGFKIQGGFGEDMASLLIKEGVSWPIVQDTLNEIVPAYSTSLDAALQGEEIVFALRSEKAHRWGAMQRTRSGGEELAWAATEPLARRLATLKCWHAELKMSLEDDEILAASSPNGQATTTSREDTGVDESAITDEKEQSANSDINRVAPSHNVNRPGDNPEITKSDILNRARPNISEHTEHEESHQTDRVEKDWEILF